MGKYNLLALVIVWTSMVMSSSISTADHSRFIPIENCLRSGPDHISWNVTSSELNPGCDETAKWHTLFSVAKYIFHYMVCEGSSTLKKQRVTKSKPSNAVFIYTTEAARVSAGFEKSLSCPDVKNKCTAWGMAASSGKEDILKVLVSLLPMEANVRSVVVASSNTSFIRLVLNTVAEERVFKWRRFLHATEWFALTISSSQRSISLASLRNISLPDFVTQISMERAGKYDLMHIFQKSRTQPIKKVSQICVLSSSKDQIAMKPFSLPRDKDRDVYTQFALTSTVITKAQLSKSFRKDAVSYLSSQKSSVAGMKITTIVFSSEELRFAKLISKTNSSVWTGVYMDILDLLSTSLGFTSVILSVNDGGFYMESKPNGDLLGVVGYLARREAGLSTMAMGTSSRRREHVDFVYPHISEMQLYIIYRARFIKTTMGSLHLCLVISMGDLICVLIGACVALTVGLFVFLMTKAMSTNEDLCGSINIRRVYDFPLHWVFQTVENYQYNSCWIMRASWGLYCVLLFASYGADLTSEATSPEVYPKINSLDDLLAHPEFNIGISSESSHFLSRMKHASAGTSLARLWEVFLEHNRSDPRTFSTNTEGHLERVLAEEYVYLGNFPQNVIQKFNSSKLDNVKFVLLNRRHLHVTVPKYAFYKDEFEQLFLSAAEKGLFLHNMYTYVHSAKTFQDLKYDENSEVKLNNLRILLPISITGVGLAITSFIGEKWLFPRRRVFTAN